MLLKHLPDDARPREKLLARGSAALADAELLALLLRTGRRGTPVLQMAADLLASFGGLSGLLQADTGRLAGIKGIGPAKSAELAAVMELARRSIAAPLAHRTVLDAPQRVKDYLQMQIGHRPHEVFGALFLDAQHRLVGFEELFRGTLAQTSVHPREVVKRALDLGAAAVVLAHNHPSGVAEPSRSDELLTRHLQQALALVDVQVLDHIVVARGAAVSFAERGLL